MAITAQRKQTKAATKGTLANNVKVQAPKKTKTATPPLRKGIVPGTVLILLAGLYTGRRVIFLKQMTSGLLLVTGIVGLNMVPAKLVNQAYVIVTSTVVPVPEDAIAFAKDNLTDEFFAEAKAHTQKQVQELKKGKIDKISRNENRVRVQKALESIIRPVVAGMGKEYVSYLASRMALRKTAKAHAMKF